MDRGTLKLILDAHAQWTSGPGGKRADLAGADLAGEDLAGADLAGADLAGANLAGTNLAGANLRDAYLHDVNLAGACLTGAYLTGAHLRDAYLHDADLTGAHLHDANLTGANLTGAHLAGTCLDPEAAIPAVSDAALAAVGFEIRGGYVYGWRTARSQHVGATEYAPGTTHVAPWFSVALTDCHPGVYLAGSAVWLEGHKYARPYVRVRCRREDIHAVGDKFRARKIEVEPAEGWPGACSV